MSKSETMTASTDIHIDADRIANVRLGRRSSQLATPLAALFFLALSVLHTWPLVTELATHSPDSEDSILNIWILGATARRLVTDPVHVFDANMYYPFRWSLATVDHQIANAVLAAPVTLASGDPLLGHNVFVLATFVLSGMTMFLLVRALTGSVGAGLFAGTVYTFSPARFDHLMHSHMLASFWLPALLLAVHRYVAEPTWRRLTAAVFLFVAAALASWYWFAFAVLSAAVVGTWALAAQSQRRSRVLLRGAAGAALAFVLLLPFALPYVIVVRAYAERAGHGERQTDQSSRWFDALRDRVAAAFHAPGRDEMSRKYGAQLQNYLAPARGATWLWAAARLRRFSTSETGFFPGIATIALVAVALVAARSPAPSKRARLVYGVLIAVSIFTAVGMALAIRSGESQRAAFAIRRGSLVTVTTIGWTVWLLWRTKRATSAQERHIRTYTVLLMLGILLSLGLRVVVFNVDLGTGIFPAYVPPFTVTHPGRYGVIASAAATVLAGIGLSILERRISGGARRGATVALCLLAANLELRAAPLDWYPVPPTSRATRWLRVAAEGAVIEFPTHENIQALYRSLYHRKPLVNGSGILEPAPYKGLENRDDLSPAMIEQLRAYFHPRYIVVDEGRYKGPDRQRLIANLARSGDALKLRFSEPGEPAIYELLPGGEGARLIRSYPADLAAGKRGLVMTGVVDGRHRSNASVLVAATLDGRPLATWRERTFTRDALVFAPFPRALDDDAMLEIVVDYTLDADARVVPIGRTGTPAPADIIVESGGARSEVRVNNRTWRGSKGYTLAAIDPRSNAVEVRTFNTSWYEEESHRMASYIDGLPDGTVVALASEYDVSRRLTGDAVNAMNRLGLVKDLRERFGWAHAAIGVKGAAPGTALECVDEHETACRAGEAGDLRLKLSDIRLY